MLNGKTCTALALILVAAASPMRAAETESDPHHSAGAAAVPHSSMMPGCMMSEAAGEAMLAARLEAVRKLKAAADPLYNAPNADRKKTTDEIMLSPMGMMM